MKLKLKPALAATAMVAAVGTASAQGVGTEKIGLAVANLQAEFFNQIKLGVAGHTGKLGIEVAATQLTTRLAPLTGGEPRLLSAPGVAQSREAKLVLVCDPHIRETTDLLGKVTLAIVGIGAVEPSSMLARSGNVFSESGLAEVAEAGGVGDISLRFFDRDGRPVRTPLDDRVIGMPLEELAGIDRVIALAGGRSKTEAIRNALMTGAVDVLVTDKFTAGRLQPTVESQSPDHD